MNAPDYMDMQSQPNIDLDDRTKWLTISEIANICKVSRQTLIYYDKHDVFKPDYIDPKGYRYYSVYQVPYLREICALKDTNLSLKEIVDNFQNRTLKNTKELLEYKRDSLLEDMEALEEKLAYINARLGYYDYVEKEMSQSYKPYIRHFPERKILFAPWNTDPMNRCTMYFTHMNLRHMANDHGVQPEQAFGSLIRKESLLNNTPITGGGAFVKLPDDFENVYNIPEGNYIVVPEGFFACICRYCMPYESQYYYDLYDWLNENHYTITGDILNECLLDTTFYTETRQQDLGQIQIPIRLPGTF